MAGYLPNVPGVRIPWHKDGSLVKAVTTNTHVPTGAWTTVSSGSAAEMNDGDGVGWGLYSVGSNTTLIGGMLAIVFPQPITLTGHNIMVLSATTSVMQMWYSTDTIDGTDGTWITETNNASASTTPVEYRNITPVNIPNVKGVRFGAYSNVSGAHTFTFQDFQLYGQWSPLTLAAWHPTLDQQINGYELDFGDVMLGSIYNKQFRIKNGRTLTANNVVVSCTSGTAEFIGGLSFSLDNVTFSSNVTIPSIAPGAISPTIYVRRTVSAGQTPNIIAMAPIDFVATTWT